MGLGHYDYERRYRRRFWVRLSKLVFLVGLLLAIGLFSYQMGIEQFKGRDTALREEVATLSRQKAELELLASQMQQAARNAEARATEAEERMAREVPSGEQARLLALVVERLNGGMDPNRLAFVIQNAHAPRNCQQPEVKRFVLGTPLTKAASRGVTFAAGTITVAGEGQSARSASGNPEAWFDPAQPVTLRITTIGGKETVATGMLPLHQSVVVDSVEHRFVFSAGPRSFVDATADRCPFP